MRRLAVAAALALVAAGLAGCGGTGQACDGPLPTPERLVPKVVRTLPHATDSFTQGLLVLDGRIYESTGLEGRSSVRVLDLADGAELQREDLPPEFFAEGLAAGPGDSLVQLTWKNRTAFVRDRSTLRQTGTHRYRGEGWGLTTLPDGSFMMSNGSDRLTRRAARTFDAVRTVTVRRKGGAADQLNELELGRWAGRDVVWANRWQTDEILRVDLACGVVTGVVDASALAAGVRSDAVAAGATVDVLNGIARLPGTDRYLLTGKLWPALYEVRFVDG